MRRPSSAVSRPLRLAALVSLAVAGTAAQAVSPLRANVPGVTDQLIIKYRDDGMAEKMVAADAGAAPSLGLAQAAAARHGVSMGVARRTAGSALVAKLDRRLPEDVVARIAAEIAASDPSVLYAEPDRMMRALAVPNDPLYANQWHYTNVPGGVNAVNAWGIGTGTGIIVGVLDTGYRPHVDLKANLATGYDFIHDPEVANDGNGRDTSALDPGDWVTANECDSGSEASDSSWHGTHVAGTVAATTNNSLGVAGVAHGAKVMPVRVLGKCGGYTSDIADAITWASGGSVPGVPLNTRPTRVINLSLGGSGACDTTTQSAINGARSRNTVVVVAAGNSNDNAANYSPASCNNVITVGANDRYGARSYYSNYGDRVHVSAAGGDLSFGASGGILSTVNTGTQGPVADGYAYYQGTSMATPHVAGVVALMLSRNPALTLTQVVNRLRSVAKKFPSGACDVSRCGAGVVDAYAAAIAATAAEVKETEQNGTLATAQVISGTNISLAGYIANASDVDIYKVTIGAGRLLRVSMAPNLTTRDFDMTLLNSAGNVIRTSEEPVGRTDSFTYTNSGSSTITTYVKVVHYSGTSGGYTLSIRR